MSKAIQEHYDHDRAAETYFLAADTWTRVRNSLAFVALAGWLALAAGFFTDRAQFQFSYLVGFLFFTSIAVGAMFYVMVQHLTGSAWSVTVRRLMESMMRSLPLALVLFVPVMLGVHYTHEWTHASAATDPVLSQKLGYLNETWFLIRGVIVIALWSFWAWKLYGISRAQDGDGSLLHTVRAHRWSAPGMLMLFLTSSVAAFDWIMSLDPHWFSTIFGVYFLSGGALAFMALLIAICLMLRHGGYLTHAINEEHYHDLGKWLFALTVFWAYIAFSQYMLIWYGNLPEEALWYRDRLTGSWSIFFPILIVGHFLIPFFSLLPRGNKRNLGLMKFFAGWILLMHFLDLHWQVMPVLHKQGFAFHWLDVAALAAVGGSYGLVFWAGLREKPLVPVGDPRLRQCLAFHNA